MKRLLPVLGVVALLGGCSASIQDLAVAPTIEGEDAQVTATVKRGFLFTSVQEVRMAVGPWGVAGGPFVPAGTASVTGSDFTQEHYAGALPGLAYGGHRLQLEADYLAGGIGIRSGTDDEELDFLIDAPAGCFSFDDGTLQGWTVAGLFDSGDSPISLPACPAPGPGILWSAVANWPGAGAVGGRGGAWTTFGPSCFPGPSDPPPGGVSYLALVSPDVSGNAAWQGIDAVDFRVKAINDGFQDSPDAQARVLVRNTDGSTAVFAAGLGAWHQATLGWTVSEGALGTLPAGSVNEQVLLIVRVPVDAVGKGGGEVPGLQIDGICPG